MPEVKRIALTTEHRSLAEAMGSDLIDITPVGPIARLSKLTDALAKKDMVRAIAMLLPGPGSGISFLIKGKGGL